ncbi:MAG TPA: hypothetical protein VHD87_15620 [Acidimicrobiales bacterium]|nr:hypothetical protein [Acidimicrobiales bacterium]
MAKGMSIKCGFKLANGALCSHPRLSSKPDCGRHKVKAAQPATTAAAAAHQGGPAPAGAAPLPTAVLDASMPDGAEALTPIPDQLEVGYAPGTAVLVGGADLVDGTATLTSYQNGNSSTEVLIARVRPEAEAKLIGALNLGGTTLVPVESLQEVHGRLQLDKDQQLWETVERLVKSYNHHAKEGNKLPEHRVAELEELSAKLDAINASHPDEETEAMMQHYGAVSALLKAKNDPAYSAPYAAGGKIEGVVPYESTRTETVTEMVPTAADGEGLPTDSGPLCRPAPVMDPKGVACWDGKQTKHMAGTQYDINLGDGYRAIFVPHSAANLHNDDVSQLGSLYVIAPPGPGHGKELVHRLGQMHLSNRPMTRQEGEWVYLTQNAAAQGLDQHPLVVEARDRSEELIDVQAERLFTERAATFPADMSEAEIDRQALAIQLEAETTSLPHRVRMLRDAVAVAAGYPSADALVASPAYDPTPVKESGWLTWRRFDMAPGSANAEAAKKVSLVHYSQSTENLLGMLRHGGVLASSDRRDLFGLPTHIGMSPGADKKTGGARSVFLRVTAKGGAGHSNTPRLVWDDAAPLLARTDLYAYETDHYGSINAQSHHKVAGQTRDPKKIATFTKSSNNEVMFRDGIDLLGPNAPSRIHCGNTSAMHDAHSILKQRGITHIGGRPIAEVVVA